MIQEFDIVIPVGPKDVNVIKEQIIHTKKNIIGYRNIYIMSNEILNQEDITDCILIKEDIYPFSKSTVEELHGKLERNGWYYQQLLKLYAGFCIPDILERYLVIDADTFFLKPTTFIQDNKCLYNIGSEYNIPYFEHMKRLSPSLYRVVNMSGICHHMIFETKLVQELFNLVESKHNDKFYNVFLKNVSKDHYEGAGASEYEIYFNYILNYHSDKIKIRELNWNDSYKTNLNRDFDYVSIHWYLRN